MLTNTPHENTLITHQQAANQFAAQSGKQSSKSIPIIIPSSKHRGHVRPSVDETLQQESIVDDDHQKAPATGILVKEADSLFQTAAAVDRPVTSTTPTATSATKVQSIPTSTSTKEQLQTVDATAHRNRDNKPVEVEIPMIKDSFELVDIPAMISACGGDNSLCQMNEMCKECSTDNNDSQCQWCTLFNQCADYDLSCRMKNICEACKAVRTQNQKTAIVCDAAGCFI